MIRVVASFKGRRRNVGVRRIIETIDLLSDVAYETSERIPQGLSKFPHDGCAHDQTQSVKHHFRAIVVRVGNQPGLQYAVVVARGRERSCGVTFTHRYAIAEWVTGFDH
jgi:hypothetical protein